MTKQDYQAFAKMIRALAQDGTAERIDPNSTIRYVSLDELIERCARIFGNDNPRFSRERFEAAAREVQP
jgi:hypothetical protein